MSSEAITAIDAQKTARLKIAFDAAAYSELVCRNAVWARENRPNGPKAYIANGDPTLA
jgi:hypothetical protein